MHRLEIFIETLAPVVLTSASNSTVLTQTQSTFGGSILRGILASRYVAEQNLTDEAHNQTFRQIFFGELKFLPANPEVKGLRSFVLPLSLQSGKVGTKGGDCVQDLLVDEKPKRGFKSFRGLGVHVDGKFFRADVKKNIFMHMSRSGEKIIGGQKLFERLAGRSTDGAIYNYEAIDAGQIFRGEVLGSENLLLKLRDGLNLDGNTLIAYVGRSRFTQYGKCLVTFGKVTPIELPTFADKIFLRLDTPLIPVDDCFLSAQDVLQSEVVDKLCGRFKLGKIFAAAVEVENFVEPWRMRRPRVSALAAGSVFELDASGATVADKKILGRKIFAGFGLRTQEGFGQLRPCTAARSEPVAEKVPVQINLSADVIDLAKKILRARIAEEVRILAQDDAADLRPLKNNTAHFFTRLNTILLGVDKNNLLQNFSAQLKAAAPDNSIFKDHLKNHRMGGKTFFDALTVPENFPRSLRDVTASKTFADVCAALKFTAEDFSDDEFFLEYLKNFFRAARKIAADSKDGDARG